MATQYQDFGSTEVTVATSTSLIAGGYPRAELGVVIPTGQAALTKGTIMGRVTASGKYIPWASGASDGSEVMRGILGADTLAATNDVTSFIYQSGEFNRALITPAFGTLTAANLDTLAALGIYLREVA